MLRLSWFKMSWNVWLEEKNLWSFANFREISLKFSQVFLGFLDIFFQNNIQRLLQIYEWKRFYLQAWIY